ncbi:MAG: pectate lyase [unclassified Hahellaceae]|nr:pectate lyase [Hahellaceae bacterium]|tara:strand:- start:20578 stop:21726 length:1149 start_codon:yes stop_codon:yes gene_type:complete
MSYKKTTIALALATLTPFAIAEVATGQYALIAKHSNLALDVAGASSADGADAIQWDYSGARNQHFKVENLGNGYYTIHAMHSGKSLDVFEFSTAAGGDIRQWSSTGNYNQQWQIKPAGNGYYTVVSRHSGLALDVWGWDKTAGADVRQWPLIDGDNQKWYFRPVATDGSTGQPPTTLPNRGSNCKSTGSQSVAETIRVNGGVFDGKCKTFNPTSALGDGSQNESQKPVFRLENGAVLKNVIIGNNGADGIHVYNGATVENVRWTNVGEDALTIKSSGGKVVLKNIEAYDGSDKFLQANAASTISVSACKVDSMGKFIRQNGGTTFPISITVDNCSISNMKEGIFRTDSSVSTARITNSTLENAGSICIGKWKSCTSANISGQ